MNENRFRARGVLRTDLIEKLWPNCSEVTARLAFTKSDGTESNYPLILDEDLAKQYEGYAVDVEGYVQPLPCRDHTGKEVRALVVTSIVPLSNQPVSTKTEHNAEGGSLWTLLLAILLGLVGVYYFTMMHLESYTDKPCYDCALSEAEYIASINPAISSCEITGYEEFNTLDEVKDYVYNSSYSLSVLGITLQWNRLVSPPFHLFEITCKSDLLRKLGTRTYEFRGPLVYDSECVQVYGFSGQPNCKKKSQTQSQSPVIIKEVNSKQ